MLNLYLHIRNLLKSEEGQDLAEYAMLVGFIALILLAAVTILGTGLSNAIQQIGAAVAEW